MTLDKILENCLLSSNLSGYLYDMLSYDKVNNFFLLDIELKSLFDFSKIFINRNKSIMSTGNIEDTLSKILEHLFFEVYNNYTSLNSFLINEDDVDDDDNVLSIIIQDSLLYNVDSGEIDDAIAEFKLLINNPIFIEIFNYISIQPTKFTGREFNVFPLRWKIFKTESLYTLTLAYYS